VPGPTYLPNMTPNKLPTYTELCQSKLPADFTGVVYSDHGARPFAAVRDGRVLMNHRRMNRWFATEAAAIAALNNTERLT
jgi:hypothetical protein